MKLTKLSAAVAIALTTALSCGTAQAEALAVSIVEVNNFQVYKYDLATATTGTQVASSDLTGLVFTSTADVSTGLNGTNLPALSGLGNTVAGVDLYQAQGSGGPVDPHAGAEVIISSASGAPNSTFAVSDQYEKGAPITGFTDASGALYDSSATLKNAGYVSLDTVGDGSTTSNNNLNAAWNFTSATNSALLFTMDLRTYLEAYVNNANAPTFATASYSVGFKLKDTTTNTYLLGNGFQFAGTGDSVSALSPFNNGACQFSGVACGSALLTSPFTLLTTGNLIIGHTYTLSARINSNADALSVPEPGILALMGLGMIGMASLRKRQIG